MTQRPTRKAGPKSLLPKGSRTATSLIDFRSLARRFPLYDGIDKLATRDDIINNLNERAAKQYQSREALHQLLYIAAVIERAVAIGEVKERDTTGKSVEDFVREVSTLTLSYVRLGRRLLKAATDGVGNEPTTLDKAFKFYEEADAERAVTKFKFKAQQPTGIVYARDALKAYTKYAAFIAAGKTPAEALAEVDGLYPTDVPRVSDPNVLTSAQRRAVLEAIAIEAIALVIDSGNEKGSEYLSRWPTVQAFLEWSDDHTYSPDEETHQLAMHGANEWNDVNTTENTDGSDTGQRKSGRVMAKKAASNGRKNAPNGRRKQAPNTEIDKE
jgi:hypothetical protein